VGEGALTKLDPTGARLTPCNTPMRSPAMLDGVRRSCVESPDRNAFFIRDRFYSYRAFAEAICAIEDVLRNNFAEERNIGILAYDDLETYAAVFATWFAGKTMVPLGPSSPPDRNARIIEEAGVKVAFSSRSTEGLAGPLTRYGTDFVCTANLALAGAVPETRRISEDEIAYVLFTSGSTGIPKGVPISHGALQGFLDAFFALGYQIDANDRFLQMFDLTFDLSLMSYCVPLMIGACAYTVPSDGIKYTHIYRLLEEQDITCALMVPSILAHIRPFFSEISLPQMRYSLFCGEALYDDLVSEWSRCIPNALVQNVYGPTEATIFCLTYDCHRECANKTNNSIVSIGRPMQGTGVLLIDELLRPVGTGEKGELCLSGRQLTPGYWRNPEKTRDAFFLHDGHTYYRTGDICFSDPDGDLMYCGRLDHQVKIQGYRVELSEIEHHVREITGLNQIAAVTCPDAAGNTTIHLFLENYRGEIPDLIAGLKTRVPPYMIPAKIATLEAMPLNVNGKIDRPALSRRAQNPS